MREQHKTEFGWGHAVRGWWRCTCGAGETDHLTRDYASLAARLHERREAEEGDTDDE